LQECGEDGVFDDQRSKYNFTLGVATSFTTHLQGLLDTDNWCTGGTYQTVSEELTWQTTTAVYEVTVIKQWARANEVSGMLTMSLRIMVPLPDKSAPDSMEGTFVWDYSQESCPDTLVQLYLGPMKVLTNVSALLVGGLVIIDGPKKDQVEGLKLTET